MASTHLVFTTQDCTRVALFKPKTMIVEHEGKVNVRHTDRKDRSYWVAKEAFDELLKQLEEV